MGCKHSSLFTISKKPKQNNGQVILKKKLSIHHVPNLNQETSNELKLHRSSMSTNKTKHLTTLLISSLERTLDGHGKYLIKRFELDTACLLFDVSRTHILLVDGKKLRLIDIETTNMETIMLPTHCLDVQEIAWSSQLNAFLLLTSDQLYQTNCQTLNPVLIKEIQFTAEGPRKSYMAVDGDDLFINRSFGQDIRRYSLKNFSRLQSSRICCTDENMLVTTIRLNSNKILALAISIGKKQMIDLVNIKTNQLVHRIYFHTDENILYPIDLHYNGQWFAKTCLPCVNIGHCLISSSGQIKRLQLFPNQDNFIRGLGLSPDNQWLIISRQYAVELYQLCLS